MVPIVNGILLSLVTAFAFGSYTSFNKVPSVVESKINPIIFNLYFMLGAMVVCAAATVAAIALGYTIAFTYLGLISGFLLTVSGFCSFVSVPRIGVAYTWAIAATTGCITAFIEGLILGTPIVSWWATIVSLIVLMSSAAVIVLIKDISACLFPTSSITKDTKLEETPSISMQSVQETVPLRTTSITSSGEVQVVGVQGGGGGVQVEMDEDMIELIELEQQQNISKSSLLIGVIFSIFAGICLASIPLPSLFVPINAMGLCYFFSLGVGCLLVFPFTLISLIIDGMLQSRQQSNLKFEGLGYAFNESNFVYSERNLFMKCLGQCGEGISFLLCETNESLWKVRDTLIPGVLSGIVWNSGNVAGIIALQYINYIFLNALVAISTPIAAMYGVFLWKELKKTHEIFILFLATFSLIGANVLLAYGLYGNFI